MNYKSLADLNNDVASWIQKIPTDFDIIVGIPRSGLLVANLISLHFNIPMTDVENVTKGLLIGGGKRCPTKTISALKPLKQSDNHKLKILVVDDSVDSGSQMKKIKNILIPLRCLYDLRFGAVYVTPGSEEVIDFYYTTISKPRVFEWNVMHHPNLSHFCIDISCLLKKHQPSLISQKLEPAIRPSGEIGFLIDCHCQLRKADSIIPEWLFKNKITYRNFIKMDKSKALNTSLIDSIIFFKAGIYNLSKSLLFIENSQTQALRIARLTKKSVLCWKTREMIQIN